MFSRPLFDWARIPARFNEMIFNALEGKIRVNPSELSVTPSNILGDVRAKYAIYGGATSVNLSSNKMVFDFPNLAQADVAVAGDVIRTIHDALPMALPEITYDRIEIESFEHLELESEGAVEGFLQRYSLPEVDQFFDGPIVARPSVKFNVASADQQWECGFAAERSLLRQKAIFAILSISLRGVNPHSSYEEKAIRVSTLVKSCYQVVGLESDDASHPS
jgi:hypothetical protein